MRERFIATAGIEPMVYAEDSILNNGYWSMAVRQGFGYGSMYTTLDLGRSGRHQYHSEYAPHPSAGSGGGVGFAAVGLRYGLVESVEESSASSADGI